MQLVIAEKPSVAKSIADVLGAIDRQDGYFEGGGVRPLSLTKRKVLDYRFSEAAGKGWRQKRKGKGDRDYGTKHHEI